MNGLRHSCFVILSIFLCVGCATWNTSNIDLKVDKASLSDQTDPNVIEVTQNDLDKPYIVLADITANVHKTTVFNADPTREQVNEQLREKASKLGANAVILVRYGEVGVGWSWGDLEGKGRAVKFTK